MTDEGGKEPQDIDSWRRRRREFSRLGSAEARQAAVEALEAAMARWFGLSYADPGDSHALALARTLRAIRIASDIDQPWLRGVGNQSRDFLVACAAARGDPGNGAQFAACDIRLSLDVELANLEHVAQDCLSNGHTTAAISERLLVELALPVSGIGGALAERGVDVLEPAVEARVKRAVGATLVTLASADQGERASELVRVVLETLAPSEWNLFVQRSR